MIYFAVVLSYLSLMILGLVDNLRGPLYPEIVNSYQIHHSMGAWIFAMTSLLSFFGAISSKFLLLRFDQQKTLNFALFLMSLGLFIFGQAQSFKLFLVGSIFFGFSMGIMGVVQNLLVTQFSPASLHQQLLSGLHSMYGLASLLAPLYVNFLSAQGLDWKKIFLYSGFIPLCLLLISILRPLKNIQHLIASEKDQTQNHKGHTKKISILAMVLCGYVMGEIMISSRLALFFRDEKKLSFSESNFKVTLFFMFLLLGRLLFSFYKFKIQVKTQLLTSLLVTTLSILLGLFFNEIFLILSGLTMAPFYPVMVSYISTEFKKFQSHALTVSMALQSFGIVVMHLGVGWVTDLFGIQWALLLGPIFLLISFFLLKFYKSMP